MPPKKAVKTAPLGLRISPDLKADLERLAEQDQRSVASYVEVVLRAHVADVSGKKKRG